jgi:hypothetical protein
MQMTPDVRRKRKRVDQTEEEVAEWSPARSLSGYVENLRLLGIPSCPCRAEEQCAGCMLVGFGAFLRRVMSLCSAMLFN